MSFARESIDYRHCDDNYTPTSLLVILELTVLGTYSCLEHHSTFKQTYVGRTHNDMLGTLIPRSHLARNHPVAWARVFDIHACCSYSGRWSCNYLTLCGLSRFIDARACHLCLVFVFSARLHNHIWSRSCYWLPKDIIHNDYTTYEFTCSCGRVILLEYEYGQLH